MHSIRHRLKDGSILEGAQLRIAGAIRPLGTIAVPRPTVGLKRRVEIYRKATPRARPHKRSSSEVLSKRPFFQRFQRAGEASTPLSHVCGIHSLEIAPERPRISNIVLETAIVFSPDCGTMIHPRQLWTWFLESVIC